MRRPELDYILTTMLDSQPEVSDLVFTVDKPLQVESFGELKPVPFEPPLEKLTPFQTEMVALNLMGDNQWHISDLIRHGSCDAAYTLLEKARFRINIFSQRGNYSIVLRKLNTIIPTRPGHRRHRFRQIHHPGRRPGRNQPNQARPYYHPGRPGGICSQPQNRHL
jgi:twitching motility protein PilT